MDRNPDLESDEILVPESDEPEYIYLYKGPKKYKEPESYSHLVYNFTKESSGLELPNKPEIMTESEVRFIIKMVISEMAELAQTVVDGPDEALALIRDCVGTDFKPDYKKPTDPDELMAQQYDALVDAEYYMENMAVRKGVNLSGIFRVVHAANMSKKFKDGTFHRNEMGKVIKPPEFRDPDVRAEIRKQLEYGAWTD